MKSKLLIIILLAVTLRADAQLDSLKVKTKLYYSLSREKHKWYGGTLYKKNSSYTITIDTIIKLSGDRRQLIVLSKCLNSVVLSKSVAILKDSIIQTDKLHLILGDFIIDGVKDNSDMQATIIYQIKNATFLLTVPKNFFLQQLREDAAVHRLDKTLSGSFIDSSLYGIYELKSYIFFDGMTMPLSKFAIIKKDNEVEKKLYDSVYPDEFFKFQAVVDINNKVIPTADKYKDGRQWKYESPTLYFSKKYGIVKARSLAYDKPNECTYTNTLELQEVKLPVITKEGR